MAALIASRGAARSAQRLNALHAACVRTAQLSRRHVQRCIAVQAGGGADGNAAAGGRGANVAVLGAGVVGLTSALRLLQELPDLQVTLMAEKWDVNTTSDGAGGLWKPYALGSTPTDDILRWGQVTFDHYMDLYRTLEAGAAGIILTSAYQLWQGSMPDPIWKEIVPHFRQLTEKELRAYDTSGTHSYGWFYTTIIADGRCYMAWLSSQLQRLGARLERRRIAAVEELAGYDLVVNCTGLGAKELWGDDSVYPIRGQVVRVQAPWIRHYINAGGDEGSDCYIIPNLKDVVIGGTLQKDDYDTTPREEDTQAILERAYAVVPSLRAAEIVREWAGLRPGRPSVRLEAEQRQLESGKQLPVVHNYGHGGSGLTLAWGCAADVVSLAQQVLQR